MPVSQNVIPLNKVVKKRKEKKTLQPKYNILTKLTTAAMDSIQNVLSTFM